ncbi:bis(5'-nucleosyl)-tetraphosphatase [asymmetrical]-like [Gigantopelta aegis]|uniref:bis(5'-nucleosyl)-tetraphosphatase [asymmetrical]-like n=1 Tax=Gigantopelta aegis TaxID=1735272 RepID=UPI001B8873D3|nr:bis(5'-nucleosyl)-tetraphosphatase [asymmetrical]-like [Gigantopelta aegis]
MASALRAAGFIIYRRLKGNTEYLLLQTSYGEHHWTPPKGHVDPGEDEYQTALRETEEEAGLKAGHLNVNHDFKKILNYDVRGKPKKVVYWLAELKDSDISVTLSDEHIAYKWVPLLDACALAKYADLQEVLKDADAYVNSTSSSK